MGKLSNIHELPSIEWREKHCYPWGVKKPEEEKYTHGASLTCSFCDKTAYIPKLNIDNINGSDPIQCPLCKEINT